MPRHARLEARGRRLGPPATYLRNEKQTHNGVYITTLLSADPSSSDISVSCYIQHQSTQGLQKCILNFAMSDQAPLPSTADEKPAYIHSEGHATHGVDGTLLKHEAYLQAQHLTLQHKRPFMQVIKENKKAIVTAISMQVSSSDCLYPIHLTKLYW